MSIPLPTISWFWVRFCNLESIFHQRHPKADCSASSARLVREIAKEEASNYSPVLIRWNVNAKVVAAATLHELYRADLKPFLDGVTQLSDEVTAVLPVAEALEAFLMDMTAGESAAGGGGRVWSSEVGKLGLRVGLPVCVGAGMGGSCVVRILQCDCSTFCSFFDYEHKLVLEWLQDPGLDHPCHKTPSIPRMGSTMGSAGDKGP
jgi:hypothetical protein